MRRFAALYRAIDASTSTRDKVEAMVAYFRAAAPADAAWAAYFLAGGKPRQVVPTALLRELACEIAGVAPWLFDEGYAVTGDLAEAIAYVLPAPTQPDDDGLANWVESRILPLRGRARDEQKRAIAADWARLEPDERFIHVKLIGGGFRVGVSRLLVQRALAQAFDLDPKRVAQRLIGYTDRARTPDAARFLRIVSDAADDAPARGEPYPFFLAHQLALGAGGGGSGDGVGDGDGDRDPDETVDARLEAALGAPRDWLAEWKYDGIRAQIVVRAGGVWIWTRGEELATERFPEIVDVARRLPEGTVLDGEILAWLPGAARPAGFALLQRRIGRLAPTKKLLAEAPVVFVAYDVLESGGADLRTQPQSARREVLEGLTRDAGLALSPLVEGERWADFARQRLDARARGVEGLMLKARDARYGTGRTRVDGTWWKWKIDPLTVDGVLVYAQAGHGRRANLYTDYTFAVWSRAPESADEAQAVFDAIARRAPPDDAGLRLVPFAKAYSGLSDVEFGRVDALVRKSTVERFGPVRSLRPSLVFELGFEGIARSPRHKSGIATRFPRMLRIRDDKPAWQADTLATLEALIDAVG
ncbi:MAG: ATP-dependent DNA ligase [Lautropia sp.]